MQAEEPQGESSFSMSFEVPNGDAYDADTHAGCVSELSVGSHEHDEDKLMYAIRGYSHLSNKYILRDGSDFHDCNQRRDSLDICSRLYLDAKEKNNKRAKEIQAKLDQDNNAGPHKLNLVTKHSYTPIRNRLTNGNIHDHLYQLSKNKEVEQREESFDIPLGHLTISSKESIKVSSRLYDRSLSKQVEGRRLREEIEKKLTPRAPTPSKRIPLSQATAMYERGLSHRARTESKIEAISNSPKESTFPKMRTQGRYKSSSRARSQTPSKRLSNQSINPLRMGELHYNESVKSRTEHSYYNESDKSYRENPSLPPKSIKTRYKSPELQC